MDDNESLAAHFEHNRSHLRAVAYRMLGSLTEADDAVQDTWLRLSRSGVDGVENVAGWLTTIVARVCLNMLRSRNSRREEPLAVRTPEGVRRTDGPGQPEDQALLADSVGLALLIVLDTLTPDERLTFVLHDMFDLPFREIAPIVGRTPTAAKQLASRARRRVQKVSAPQRESDPKRQREVVDAFFAAARRGDFNALVAVLHPDVVTRTDAGPQHPTRTVTIHGADAVARQALLGGILPDAHLDAVLINSAPGVVVTLRGRPYVVMSFIITDGTITTINAIIDPEYVSRIAAAVRHR